MAKDGTRRGGARPGSGRKKKEKPADVETVLHNVAVTDEDVAACPNCHLIKPDSLSARIYVSIFEFAKNHGADQMLPPELVELFSVSYARWCEVEEKISEMGFISAHPTTGLDCKSPLVSVSESYSKQAQNYWYSIWNIVREGEPVDETDDMEGILDGALKQ